MRYINKRTGAIVDSPSVIKGKDWEVVEKKEEALRNQEEQIISDNEEVPMTENDVIEDQTQEEYVEEEINLEEMTKKELVQFAKDENIEVNEKETKQVIMEAIVKALS